MRKLYLAAALAGTVFAASTAEASVQVIGNSIGHSCYVSATSKNGSRAALFECNAALESGLLSQEDTVATYVNRGIVKLYGGAHESAISDFDRAIALDPQEPDSYLNKASTILRMGGSPAEAVPLFDEALRRKTRRPEVAFYGRAVAHEASGNLSAAYRDYRRAQAINPRWDEPRRELSRFQVRRASSPQ